MVGCRGPGGGRGAPPPGESRRGSALLRRIKETGRDDIYVFSGPPKAVPNGQPKLKAKPLTDIKRTWAAVCRMAQLPNARIHDLRHTFARMIISNKNPLPVVGALLGHTQASTTQRYAHFYDEPFATRPKLLEENSVDDEDPILQIPGEQELEPDPGYDDDDWFAEFAAARRAANDPVPLFVADELDPTDYDGLVGPRILVQHADRHRELMTEVAKRLGQIAGDIRLIGKAAREALHWLAAHPHAVKMFLLPNAYTLVEGEPRKPRTNMLSRHPASSPQQTIVHQILYGEILGQIVHRLTAKAGESERLPKFDPTVLGNLVDAYLTYLEVGFQETGSPLFVWRSFHAARRADRTASEWVLSFLEDCAERLDDLRSSRSGRLDQSVFKALGFSSGAKGGHNPAFAELPRLKEKLEIYLFMHQQQTTDSSSSKEISAVAVQFSKEPATIKKFYKEIEDLLAAHQRA
jgi:hypothetical protein